MELPKRLSQELENEHSLIHFEYLGTDEDCIINDLTKGELLDRLDTLMGIAQQMKKELILRGKSWYCGFCNTHNPEDYNCCKKCGYFRNHIKKENKEC